MATQLQLIPQNSVYSFKSPRPQYFELPFNMIRYLMDSCTSPAVFLKLLQTCKHFFAKKPVVIVGHSAFFGTGGGCFFHGYNGRPGFQINESFKYWTTNRLDLLSINGINYIYRANLKQLSIDKGDLTFKDICLLLHGGQINHLYITDNSIRYADGTPVTLPTILSKCPRIIRMGYGNRAEEICSQTFRDLPNLPFQGQLYDFQLNIFKCKDDIDPLAIGHYLSRNASRLSNVHLNFVCGFSQDVFNKLQTNLLQTYGAEFPSLCVNNRLL